MATEINGIVGPQIKTDGTPASMRVDRQGSTVVTESHARYHEAAVRQKLFVAFLSQGTSTVAAGNITGAAAAASTQFAVWNPLSSGINMVLQKLFIAVFSGTAPAGAVIHNTFNSASVASTLGTVGAVRNCYSGGPVGAGLCLASAAGANLTGGLVLLPLRTSNFSTTATAQASPAGIAGVSEEIAGDIVLPPGQGYVPCWGAAGTTFLVGYSLTWEEVPV